MEKLPRIVGAVLRLAQASALYRRICRCLVARGVTIREATDADRRTVQGWLNPDANPEQVTDRSPLATDLVAYWHGYLAGFVQLVHHPPEHAPYVGYWLFSLYIKPPLKGAGIGEKLSQKVIARASAKGAQRLDLQVFNDNFPAIQLYRKLGFKNHTIPEIEPNLAREITPAGRRLIVMRKQLEPQA